MNQKEWLRAAGHHRPILNKRQYGAALSLERNGSQAAAHHLCCGGRGREGAHWISLFVHSVTSHSNPAMPSASLRAAEPRFISLLAQAKVQLLAPAHIPAAQPCTAALCSTTRTLSNLPCSHCWSCSEPGAGLEISQRLAQPQRLSHFYELSCLEFTFFTGIRWSTGVCSLNK